MVAYEEQEQSKRKREGEGEGEANQAEAEANQARGRAGAGGGAGDGVFLWERLERPAPTLRPTLTARRIAEAAVRIADSEGSDAVTMRRLASELGVAPMAAYRHVSGKDELWELMVDFVYGEVPLRGGVAGWREAMRALALATHDVLLKHSWVTGTALGGPTPNQLAVTEHALRMLDGLGLNADVMMAVFRTVSAYVDGAVAAEIGLRRLMEQQGWASGDDVRAGLASRMTWLVGTGRYARYERYLREARRKDDLRWQFETGLNCVLDGIAAHLGI